MKKLVYGTEEIHLDEDVDTDALGGEIRAALEARRDGPWVEVTARNGIVHSLLVSPGVPIRFEERDDTGAPRRGIISV